MTDTTPEQLEAILAAAHAAAPAWAATAPSERARILIAAADALEAAADELVPIGMRETGLAEARLRGELNRTHVQLRLFAETIRDGAYLDVRLDRADADFVLGPRPDLRRVKRPLGVCLNFAASNFPFAFSVAGGDTAAALAAGCPVILKGHSGHPELSVATARVFAEALVGAGAPEGVFALIQGREAGTAALDDERVDVGTFTGSIRVGRMLADRAAARPRPIPFYGELGSVNPAFATADALAERGEALAEGFVGSVSGSAGQLCTKPGFLFVPAESAEAFGLAVAAAAEKVGEHRLLDRGIGESYRAGRDEIRALEGVRTVVEGAVRVDEDGFTWATPTVVAVTAERLREARGRVLEEVFGPFAVLVEYRDDEDLAADLAELFEGNLTGTLHLGAEERGPRVTALVEALSRQCGRVLFAGWPTGVAVTPAQQHGGPYPATTNDSSTSVGTAAIDRMLRPVAYQDCPQDLLPEPLQDANPWGVPQRIEEAGLSRAWGR